MSSQRVRSAQHTAAVAAPAGVVYGLLADAPRWPVLLPSFVHVERVDFDGVTEELRLWRLRHGTVCSERARRVLRPRERRVEFELQDDLPAGAPAYGVWSVVPDGADRCLLTLRHERPAGPGELPRELGTDVAAELSAVREAAERWDRLDELLLSFEDSAHVSGPPELVYDFLYRVGDWAELLPHVDEAEVVEDRPGVQTAILRTCAPETGETLVSESVRLCFPAAGRIVHKETAPTDPVAAHYGEWYLEPDATGVRVVSAHQVMLRESPAQAVRGEGALPVDARRYVREWLGRADTEALDLARWYAESAVRRQPTGPPPSGDPHPEAQDTTTPLTGPVTDAGRRRAAPPAPLPLGPLDTPADAARYAACLEALLGDPRDRGNPTGRSALRAAGYGGLPGPPAGLPGTTGVRPAPGQLARALRPLLRRDLALAHAWSIRPLLTAPVPHPAAALLGPAALLASAAGVLRGTAGIVDGLSRYDPGAGQWRPVLAAAFADLLACESLTAVALRSCSGQEPDPAGPDPGAGSAGPGRDGPGPPRQPGESLRAVVGHLVPQLVGELLEDLDLVLGECGLDGGAPERRTVARILEDRPYALADRTATATAQARSVGGLTAPGARQPDHGTELTALFRITETMPAVPPDTDGARALAATLAGATGRLAAATGPGTAALARVGRRLVVEQRALRTACAAIGRPDPADPAARALADRRALLLLAAAVLGVREAAAGARLPFLGGTDWALLTLGRITGRLGLPLPGRTPHPQPEVWPEVWEELARRAANGFDCDLHTTRLPS